MKHEDLEVPVYKYLEKLMRQMYNQMMMGKGVSAHDLFYELRDLLADGPHAKAMKNSIWKLECMVCSTPERPYKFNSHVNRIAARWRTVFTRAFVSEVDEYASFVKMDEKGNKVRENGKVVWEKRKVGTKRILHRANLMMFHEEQFVEDGPWLLTHICSQKPAGKYSMANEALFDEPGYDRRPWKLDRPKVYKVWGYDGVFHGEFTSEEAATLCAGAVDGYVMTYTVIDKDDHVNYYKG